MTRLVSAAALAVALLAGVSAQAVRPSTIVDGDQLLKDLRVLSADDMQGRQVGTAGGERARAYVVERFAKSGIMPFGDGYTRPFSFSTSRGSSADRRGANVVGRIDGTRDTRRFIVVTAHYDHIGTRNNEVYNGADDNASGAAALFAIGKYFSQHRPAHSLIIAALDGEEAGLRGARALIAEPPVDLSAIVVNVNLDMIGRDKDDRLYAAGTHAYPFLKPFLTRVAATAPVKLLLGHDDPNARGVEDWTRDSDHYAFHQAKIPFVYLGVEDFDQHHKATDDYETITHDFYVRAVETAIAVIREFDAGFEDIAARRGQSIELTTPSGTLSGTLHLPRVGRSPVVLMIGGSGAASQALAAEGIASLRYERRGTESIAIADAAAWITQLRNDSRFSAVVVAASGEAAAIAMLAARAARADAVLVIHPADLPGLVASTRLTTAAMGVPEEPESQPAAAKIASWIRGVPLAQHPMGERRSLRDVVIAEVDGSRIAIEYGRPSKRGRAIWGALVPWNRWWMPGADESTTLTTNETLVFGALTVPAGDYTLYTQPGPESFKLILNKETGQFHTTYQADRDLGRVEMTRATRREAAEQLTFALEANPGAGGGVLKLIWDDREYAVPFVVKR